MINESLEMPNQIRLVEVSLKIKALTVAKILAQHDRVNSSQCALNSEKQDFYDMFFVAEKQTLDMLLLQLLFIIQTLESTGAFQILMINIFISDTNQLETPL